MLPELIGLIPAAGRATRLPGLRRSKELLRVRHPANGVWAPVIDHLLTGFEAAGIRRALGVLRVGKWDLAEHLGTGKSRGLTVGWVVLEETRSIVESLAAALPLLEGREIALGFPDVLLEPRDGFSPLGHRLRAGADAVLGLYPSAAPSRSDLVETDSGGRVHRIRVKDPHVSAGWAWMTALWNDRFSRFVLQQWEELAHARLGEPRSELYPGDVLQAA